MNAIETLRNWVGFDPAEPAIWDALAKLETLLQTAEDLVRLPFGSLDQRDFYRVREAVRDVKGDTT